MLKAYTSSAEMIRRGTGRKDEKNMTTAMSEEINPKTDPDKAMLYQIRIEGCLGRQWAEWFGGLSITPQENGDTLITGSVVDQAALFGLLRKVRDLGMPLISVKRLLPGQADVADVKRQIEEWEVNKGENDDNQCANQHL